MKLVMSVAHRFVVLDFGKKIAEALLRSSSANPAVIAAYLGASEDEAQR